MQGKNETVSTWACFTSSLGRALAKAAQREGCSILAGPSAFHGQAGLPTRKTYSCTTDEGPFPTTGKSCDSSQPPGKPWGAATGQQAVLEAMEHPKRIAPTRPGVSPELGRGSSGARFLSGKMTLCLPALCRKDFTSSGQVSANVPWYPGYKQW